MTITFYDPCPLCNALVAYSTSLEIVCPHCGNRLLVGSSDPTGHDISEIDPDVPGGAMGAFHLDLHAVGTNVCVTCRKVFPHTFECCPGLVDLAFESYLANDDRHSPRTKERIAEFFQSNPKVVANTTQLRAVQHRHDDLDEETYAKIRATLESLGMIDLVADFEDRK